jgi:hypothetical protein
MPEPLVRAGEERWAIRLPSKAALTFATAGSSKVQGISSTIGVALLEGDADPDREMMPHIRVTGHVPPSTLARAAGVHRSATLLDRRWALRKIKRSMRPGPARNGVNK